MKKVEAEKRQMESEKYNETAALRQQICNLQQQIALLKQRQPSEEADVLSKEEQRHFQVGMS